MIEITHQPKGSMCAVCIHKNNDCSNLEFSKMKEIGGFLLANEIRKIVRCTEFKREVS